MWVAYSDSLKEEQKEGVNALENEDFIFVRPNELDLVNNFVNIIRKCTWNLLATL